MQDKEILNLNERAIHKIQASLVELENLLPMNHPVRNALCDSRQSLNGAIKINRLNPSEEQLNWIYKVSSAEML